MRRRESEIADDLGPARQWVLTCSRLGEEPELMMREYLETTYPGEFHGEMTTEAVNNTTEVRTF